MVKQWEKDILERQMKSESVAIWQLEKVYNKAHQDSLEKLAILKGKEPTPSVVRQVAFQEEITKQLSTVYDDLYKKSYVSVKGFLDTGAEDAFYGALYSLNKQGIPMAMPLPTDEIAQITMINPSTGFKLSDKLYKHTELLGKKVKEEISRGLATDLGYKEIARNLKNSSEASYKQAVRIARTEGHRVNGEVSFMAMNKAKDEGADIVKQWDSTLDKRTRKSHAQMDGQIRELNQKFTSGNGKKTLYQGGFGVAEEDINCRCTILQRARWMLEKDGEPPTKWDNVSKELKELNEKDYDGFKQAVKKLHPTKVAPPIIPPIPDIPDVVDEPPASTLKAKIDALRNDDAKYTKEQLMEAGSIVFDDIQKGAMKELIDDYTTLKVKSSELYSKVKKAQSELADYGFENRMLREKLISKISKETDEALLAKYRKELDDVYANHDIKSAEFQKKTADAREVWLDANTKSVNARRKLEDEAPSLMKAKIGEVRAVGGVSSEDLYAHMNNSRSPMKKVVANAYDYYPTDWIDKSIARGTLTPKKVDRGFYQDYSGTIAISGGSDAGMLETAIHELGHRFERSVPDILNAEKEFYEYRTAGEKLQWLGAGYDKSEVTRVDHFVDSYMGKDYGGRAYELVSMGFEYAFTNPTALWKDEEYAKWIYGILTLY